MQFVEVKSQLKSAYRPDIDGLRAIAVLAVVLYHAFPSLIPGGFTGVDVFFVISGFLISGNIYKEAAERTFSLKEFYRRRVRRILPALTVVMLTCLVFGWFALYPNELIGLGKSSAWGAAFSSNIGFYTESGYFDVESATKPLLHLWSLGVEEQFYIFWPLLILFLVRLDRFMIVGVIGVVLISFTASLYMIKHDQPAAFYLPQYRIWELASGALVALLARRGITANSLAAWIGIMLIAAALVFVKDGASFPGIWALLPVAGACLIILSEQNSFANKVLLGNRLMSAIGLISFPLYLWHWPMLAFAHLIAGGEPSLTTRITVVAVAFVLSCITYWWIEKPLRYSKKTSVTFLLVLSLAVNGTFGLMLVSQGGLPNRSAVAKQQVINSLIVGPTWKYTKNEICTSTYPSTFRYFCSQEKPSPPTVILLGNSFANHLYGGLVENKELSKQNFLSYGSCQPDGVQTDCLVQREIIERNPSIKFAILNSLYPRFDDSGKPVDLYSGNPVEDNGQSKYEGFLEDRITFLEKHGIVVILFRPKPEVGYDPRTCFSRPFARAANDCKVSIELRDAQEKGMNDIINRIAEKHPGLYVFDQNPFLCDRHGCDLIKDGLPLLRDKAHYNELGSRLIVDEFVKWSKHIKIGITD